MPTGPQRAYLLAGGAVSVLALSVAVTVSALAVRVHAEQAPAIGPESRREDVAFAPTALSEPEFLTIDARVAAAAAEPATGSQPEPSAAPPEAEVIEIVVEEQAPGPAPSHLTASGQAERSRNQIKTKGRISNVDITFYDCVGQGFCGAMYNGRKVYQGAAACSWNLAIGTKFIIIGDPTRRAYTCEDRGLLENTWVDIFWNSPRDGRMWQAAVGRKGTIEIVALP